MSVLNDALHIFTQARPFIGGGLCILGGGLTIVGAIGSLRFPDFYTRLHAASVADTGSVLVMLLGMAFLSPNWLILVKLLAVGIFMFLTGPTAAHTIANAAHTAGLQPIIGPVGTETIIEDED